MATVSRPKYLNLFKIRLPLPGFVSILHRISGFGMFVALAPLLWVFETSLKSEKGFELIVAIVDLWIIKMVFIGLFWAFAHHFFAGIRFLLLDIHWGTELIVARRSSALVLTVSLLATVTFGIMVW